MISFFKKEDRKDDLQTFSGNNVITVKLLGNPGVGKTSLALSMEKRIEEDRFIHSVLVDPIEIKVTSSINKEKEKIVKIYDSNCRNTEYISTLHLKTSMIGVDVFVICVSMCDMDTLRFTETKNRKGVWERQGRHEWFICNEAWYDAFKEVEKNKGKIILVGTKMDLNNDEQIKREMVEKGSSIPNMNDLKKLGKKIKACCTVVTSSKTRKGVKELAEKIVEVHENENKKKRGIFNKLKKKK